MTAAPQASCRAKRKIGGQLFIVFLQHYNAPVFPFLQLTTMSGVMDDEAHESDGADLQMTMAASVVLEHLPRDAARALDTAGELEQPKGAIMSAQLSNVLDGT